MPSFDMPSFDWAFFAPSLLMLSLDCALSRVLSLDMPSFDCALSFMPSLDMPSFDWALLAPSLLMPSLDSAPFVAGAPESRAGAAAPRSEGGVACWVAGAPPP